MRTTRSVEDRSGGVAYEPASPGVFAAANMELCRAKIRPALHIRSYDMPGGVRRRPTLQIRGYAPFDVADMELSAPGAANMELPASAGALYSISAAFAALNSIFAALAIYNSKSAASGTWTLPVPPDMQRSMILGPA